MRSVLATAVLFAFWVAMSGQFSVFLLLAGLASSIAVVAFAHRLAVMEAWDFPGRLGLAAVTYWPWLAKEIVKSAWDVARIIVHPRLPISPCWVRVPADQGTVVGRVTYANSITLTPGTITVGAEGGEFLVHALTRESAAGLESGDMGRRVRRFEGTL